MEDTRERIGIGRNSIKECKQMRVSVVFPDKTIMLSNDLEIEAFIANKLSVVSFSKCTCTRSNRRQYLSGTVVYCEECNRPI